MTDRQLSHDDYTIGWICALPKTELVAAAAMLDEEHRILPAADPRDTNTYLLGRIGDHNVAIACLPAETTGKVSAATVAKDMLRSFPSIKFGLMVGIGGGVPYKAQDQLNGNANGEDDPNDESESDTEEIQDIRLGDVVVGLHSKSSEAVVQYDFGKSLQEKQFVHTGGKLNKPPHIVLNAVAMIQANHTRGRYKISELLSTILSDNLTMVKFQHQGFEEDRLFKPEVVHEEGKKSCRACCGLDNVNLVKRRDRSDIAPKIHYGTIGSADQVMKDAILRDQWASKENILCFEMEAAGLMDSFPCLVIRGICDYADSHKNKIWQSYAAATAASYAKELLQVIPGQGVTMLSPIEQQLSDLSNTVKQGFDRAFEQEESHHQKLAARMLTEDQRCCHQAFKTSTYEQYKNINPDRVQGTCEWVLKSSEYRRWWTAACNDLLWISADPGCGKSVLAKSLIDDVFEDSAPSVSICYFFFKDNDEQNSLAPALCAILHQLFTLQPQLLRYAVPFWERNKDKIQQETEDLWRIFIAATSDPAATNTVCIFDALDECRRQDQKQLIEKLRAYYDKASLSPQKNWLKFLVTSRPYDEIREDFQSLIESFPQIHLRGEEESDQIRSEISLVAKIRMADLGKKLKLKKKTQERLENQLLQMEHRTYLWLHLAIDDIHTTFRNSLRPDQEPVQLIPKSVNEAYKKILDRVDPQQEPVVRTILQIIVGARRPLTIQEMAMALGVATSPNARTAEEAGVNPDILSGKIRHLCGLFVFIKDFRIYLIHQTAREFLLKRDPGPTNHRWYFEHSDTEVQMAQICVRYLLMDDLESKGREAGIQNLLEYSAQNWPGHFREISSTTPELVTCVCHLYNFATERFALWFPIFWKAAMPYTGNLQMNALHLAAFNGHIEVIYRLLMDGKSAINDRDITRATALQWASWRGHYNSVQILLDSGADVNAQGGEYGNAQGGEYGNALQAASSKGHVEIVQQLLAKGADVNAQSRISGNALQIASLEGHVETVQHLLAKGADINAQSGLYGNALQVASERGHIKIVQQLLAKGADVNAQGGQFGNALQAASGGGHVEIMQQLLSKGADVNTQSGFYGNALQAASSGGHVEIVQQLLAKGADVNTQGGKYGNALQAASKGGHIETIQHLLAKGADVNAQGGEYGNALQAASERGHIETVQHLLAKGADVNAQGGFYGNALYAASARGHVEIVQQLLAKGADVNAQGGRYGNALQVASFQGHAKMVQQLLAKGADVNAQGGQFGNALYAASSEGHVEIMQQLLANGADVNAQGGFYGNALQAASSEGHVEIVQQLLAKGADVNTQGGKYGNALQAASEGGHVEIMRHLLVKGADVNAQGGDYGNALQAASERGHIETVQHLLAKGADVNAQGGFYGNALYAASARGHVEIVQQLLAKGADVNAQGGEYGNALQAASFEGYFELVQQLLAKGADGNALQAASSEGHVEIVQQLLAKGADVNAQDGFYGNALQAASSGGHVKIVQQLLAKGANVNAQGGHYGNALQAASSGGYIEAVRQLLANGADVNAQGGQYGNALQAASVTGHQEIVKLLQRQGATSSSKLFCSRTLSGLAKKLRLIDT